MNQTAKLIHDFLKNLTATGRRDTTVRNYRLYLNRLNNWLNNHHLDLSELNQTNIEQFTAWLKQTLAQQTGTLKDSTINYHLIALRSLCRYLKKNNLPGPNLSQIGLKKIIPISYPNINPDDLNQWRLAPLQTKEPSLIQWRDKALIELLICTGLKTAAVSRLNRTDLSADQASLKTAGRSLPLSPEAVRYLATYLAERHDTDPALFISHDRAGRSIIRLSRRDQRLSSRSIERLLNNYCQQLKLTVKITPSLLRYHFAQQLLNQGLSISQAQKILGHKHATTTKLYQPKN